MKKHSYIGLYVVKCFYLSGENFGVGLLVNFKLVRKHQTIFQSGCTILQSHQQCMRVIVSPHPHNTYCLLFIIAILVSVKWYFMVVLNYISLLTNNVSNFFMCLLKLILIHICKYIFK